ncbi:MAG: PD-(D/E)XK nuclease domain-containing protein [Amoebophilaceae bacterium]|nr:PD-(D/E)XK nuclease domain-containing protein [Amoebophilaceae bacterium]
MDTNEAAFWSLLLFAGYLKAEKSRFFEELFMGSCWNETQYKSFLKHFIVGDIPLFMRDLGVYLLHTSSSFNTKISRKSEGFYHGFMLAMLASLSDTHYVQSNRESGYGRYDVLVIPKWETSILGDVNKNKVPVAILLEFKHVQQEEKLESSAKFALEQIQSQSYRTVLLSYPYVKEVVEVGIAFSGKAATAAYSVCDLVNKQTGPVQLTDKYQEEW